MLTEIVKENIRKHALDESPNECCGIVLDYSNSIPCKNISTSPNNSFMIDNNEVEKYLKQTLGYYHSHKSNSQFSNADIMFSEKLNKPYFLYVIESDVFNSYIPTGKELPYENRDFWPGYLDCLTLFEDYYRRELNLSFPNTITHPVRFDYKYWESKQKSQFSQYDESISVVPDFFIDNGFNSISLKSKLQKHDIIVSQSLESRFPSHVLIFLGNNKVLTYNGNSSEVMPYRNAIQRTTKYIFRHTSLN